MTLFCAIQDKIIPDESQNKVATIFLAAAQTLNFLGGSDDEYHHSIGQFDIGHRVIQVSWEMTILHGPPQNVERKAVQTWTRRAFCSGDSGLGTHITLILLNYSLSWDNGFHISNTYCMPLFVDFHELKGHHVQYWFHSQWWK